MGVPEYDRFPGPPHRMCTDNFAQKKRPSGGNYKRPEGHGGCDLRPSVAGKAGEPVFPGWRGIVEAVGHVGNAGCWGKDYGNRVLVKHGFGHTHEGAAMHEHVWYSFYAHLKDVRVKKGQFVTPETELGGMGSTGSSTAPHCHHEVHTSSKWDEGLVDPHDLLERARVKALADIGGDGG